MSEPSSSQPGTDFSMGTDHASEKSSTESLSQKDKVGTAGDALGVVAGVAAGASVAGVVAGAAGATTLLGSTTLSSVLGSVLLTTTPVGWVIGTAAAGGLLAVGITKLVRSGATQDQIRTEIHSRLFKKKELLASQSERPELEHYLAMAMEQDKIDQAYTDRIWRLVDGGHLAIPVVLNRIKSIVVYPKD